MRRIYNNGMRASQEGIDRLSEISFSETEEKRYKSPELDALKKEIQWDVFWDIVDEEAKKSGIKKPNDLNKLNPQTDIVAAANLDDEQSGKVMVASYEPVPNKVAVNYNLLNTAAFSIIDRLNEIKKELKEAKKDSEQSDGKGEIKSFDKKLFIIHTLFHELVHSISPFDMNIGRFSVGPSVVVKSDTIGSYFESNGVVALERGKIVHKNTNYKSHYFEEAFVQKLSLEILGEYSQRTGAFSREDVDAYSQFCEEDGEAYGPLVAGLKSLCDVVGLKAGVGGDIVWKAFVRGGFYLNTLKDPNIRKWFADAISPKFLDELSMVGKIEDFKVMLKKYNIPE